jgi:hypothetical protein
MIPKPRTRCNQLFLLEYKNGIKAIRQIARNEETKFGFPNVPRIDLYGLFHPMKSPNSNTHAQYNRLISPEMNKEASNNFMLRRFVRDKIVKKIMQHAM